MKVLLAINPAFAPSITAERLAYNAALPPVVMVDANGAPLPPGQTLPNPALSPNDTAFVQMKAGELVQAWFKKHAAPPPGAVVRADGVPLELRKWQVLIGLRRDAMLDQVLTFIGTLSQEAQDLWRESTAVDRDSPLFELAKQHFGWTDATIDGMYLRYSQITLADVAA